MANHKSDNVKINPKKHFEGRIGRAPKRISESYLHNSALYYLERFSASKKHFIFVMLRKVKRSCMYHSDQDYDECAAMVAALADKFEALGLINDELYTSGKVAALRRKGLSRGAIISKMHAKGISKEDTVNALKKLDNEQYDNEEDAERRAALKFAKKKCIGSYFKGKEQDIKRSLGILARAGFSYEIAKYVMEARDSDSDSDSNE